MLKSIEQSSQTGFELAVIGMSGRFPGAGNIHQFWDNLKNGIESLSFLSNKELEESGITPGLLRDENYVKTAGGVLENIEYFDALFFNYTPTEAIVMNPQMRIFHECAWEALEDAGYDAHAYNGAIGIYAGAYSSFFWQGLTHLSGKCDELGGFDSNYLNDSDFLATRIAYKLGLKGPAFTVQTACSTSLVAIHLACQGLLNGECDMALAGSVTITPGDPGGYMFQEGMIFSPDGHCRAFDARAKGTTVGNGAGIVLLKTLEDAIADRDHIYALVKGAAINNDGIRKIGYTAPSMEGQAEVIRTALQLAEAEPESISYLEAHGTGTLLGDPVEIQGLKLAFNTDKKGFCAIGSVKTNIGHLDAAAGAAGFIKTVLALKHRQIPPSLHFETPNPKIDFDNSPFYVNQTLSEWKNDKYPLRAGVSSFGIGGTNAHVILEEFSEGTRGLSRDYQLILLSAKSKSALEQMTQNLAEHFKKNPGINLADSAYTLQIGRKAFKYRRMLVCDNGNEVARLLSSPDSAKVKTHYLEQDSPPIVFMFPGLGAQYVNMGRELYEKEPLFRQEMDHCFEILEPLMDYDIKEILYPGISLSQLSRVSGGSSKDHMVTRTTSHEGCVKTPLIGSPRRGVNQTEIAPIVIFIFEYVLAKLLMTWGINPYAMIGYSFGEYAAACVSGVFSLEDALALVVYRAQLIQKMPEGAMLSVPLSAKELTPLLTDKLSIAIDNGPSCIAAGSNEIIDALERQMKERKVICMRLASSRAIHSKMMVPILNEFKEIVRKKTLNRPQIPYISNLTGNWMTVQEAADPAYWARHLRGTVRFADGIKRLVKEEDAIFVEIGPGRDISTLVLRHIQEGGNSNHQVISLVRHPGKDISDDYFLLSSVGRLWLLGVEIDWDGFNTAGKFHRVPLPTYPFERQRYWIEKDQLDMNRLGNASLLAKKTSIADWFYIPSWKRVEIPADKQGEMSGRSCWLVFIDTCGLGIHLAKQLEQKKQDVIIVKTGTDFLEKIDNHFTQFTVNPQQDNHYDVLFSKLKQSDMIPDKILHLWNVTTPADETPGPEFRWTAHLLELGFYSLLNIARAAGKQGFNKEIQITVVTNGMQEVTGEERIFPGKATIIGPVKTIPTEYKNIKCCSIDIILPGKGTSQEEKLVNRLIDESEARPNEPVIAFRGSHRWVQVFEPRRLEPPGEKSVRLRQQGVYLVTGGLGGIGLALAQYLAKSIRARLVLTGRTALPARGEWEQWLNKPGKDQVVKDKIRKVKELEELGAEVLVFNVDVSNREQMQAVIHQAEKQFAPINGIIHAAGIADGEMIQRRTRARSEAIFAAKIKGTLILHALQEITAPDFFMLCSSISSILPQMGQVGYCAANAFLDAFAIWRNTRECGGTLTASINWDRWQGIGIARIAETQHKKLTGKDLTGGITSQEGVETFKCILADTQPQVVVSTHDLGILLRRAYTGKTYFPGKKVKEVNLSKTLYQRPELDSEYVEPRNETQQTLADILGKFFGFRRVGIRDDFFDLGGDSLKALIVLPMIHKALDIEIPIAEIFNRPTIESLAEFIEESTEKSTYSPIKLTEEKDYYPLSSAQTRLYILQQINGNDTTYNQPNVMALEGELNKEILEETFRKLIERHDNLRTSFEIIRGDLVQRVCSDVEFEIEYHIAEREAQSETSNEEPGAPGPARCVSIIQDFIRPFDLSKAPLLRTGLINTEEKKNILMVDMHHIIADGVSLDIFAKDFMHLYANKDAGEGLPRLRIQYKDYSQWKNKEKEQERLKREEAYWLKEFQGDVPVLNLPTDYPRPALQSFEGNRVGFEISGNQMKGLRNLAARGNATLYMVLLAVYNVLLAKLSGQEDMVIGSPTAGRSYPELQHIIGMFVNTLPLRNRPTGEKVFLEFLLEVKERTLLALENQDYPFEDLVEQTAVNRDTSRNPLFDVMFVLQSTGRQTNHLPGMEIKNDGLKLEPYPYENQTAKFDLNLSAVEGKDKLYFTFEYSSRLFKKETDARFIRYFKKIISSVIETPGKKISEIEIITGEEKDRILDDFNDTRREYPKEKFIHELFEKQAAKTPDHVALVGKEEGWKGGRVEDKKEEGPPGRFLNPFGELHLTYKQLNNASHQLAHVLRYKGVKPDTLVAIMVERSAEMIVGILAILKTGGAYLPIDPSYPEERIKYMLEDSNAKLMVTTRSLAEEGEKLEKGEVRKNFEIVFLDFSPLLPFHPSTLPSFHLHPSLAPAANLAYIIYTSGSTGKPKGVMVEHPSLLNILWIMQTEYPFGQWDTYLFKTAYIFDVSVTELFGWFLGGGRLVILQKDGEKDPQKILDIIEKIGITHINFVPSMFNSFVEGLNPGNIDKLSGLKYIFLAGEALLPEPVNQFRGLKPLTALENIYGPTEVTVYSSKYALSEWNGLGSIPIGKPLQNIGLFILDKYNRLQPIGVPGELVIGGVGVARGYLNNPELTSQRFINNKQITNKNVPGKRIHMSYMSYMSYIYKTGDRVRWLPDGNIEFLGRMDHQVKLRGYRLEPGEIESRLQAHKEIKEAVVAAVEQQPGERSLCAYIVHHSPGSLKTAELKQYLAETLPEYMIPAYFVSMEKLPLSRGGKIDRQALPRPDGNIDTGVEYVPARTKEEKIITQVWQEVLQLDKVGVNDNFFDLGGNSLKIIKVGRQLQEAFKRDIPVVTIFRYPRISALVRYLNREEGDDPEKPNLRLAEVNKGKNKLKNLKKKMRQR